MLPAGQDSLAGKHVDHCLLEACRHVGDRNRLTCKLASLHPAGHGGLQAGEREVETVAIHVTPGRQAAREQDIGRVALSGDQIHLWPAGKRQPEDSGHLVEGLACRIIDRGSQRSHVTGDIGHQQQAGVPAGHQHRHRRLRQRAVLDGVDGDVRGEVVNPIERFAQGNGERLGCGHSHQQRPGQARAGSDRYRIQIFQAHSRVAAGLVDHGNHGLQVRPAGHLRHHATESRMLVDAAGNGVSQQRVTADDSDPCLVAGGLDPQHQGSAAH